VEPNTARLIAHPQLLPFTPLLYVGWADGVFDEAEQSLVRDAVKDSKLSKEARDELMLWVDSPPSSTELMRLHRYIESQVSRRDARMRSGLVDLGFAIADEGEAERRALEELEVALGIKGQEAVRRFFAQRPPVKQTFGHAAASFSPQRITALLDGEYAAEWAHVRELVQRDSMKLVVGLGKERYREDVLAWVKILCEDDIGALSFPKEFGGGGRVDGFVKYFEALAMHDLSLVVKAGVQFGLFGGAILNLGTKEHHARLLKDVGSAALLGGFAMTELGHGSNVRELETVARFDKEDDAFVLHTPSVSARKEWIGNAAVHGQSMVVFAQLECDGAHGVHAFYVPVRDADGALLPGVSIEDCGHKMGLNGVDNGRLWFDHVRVPREDLLGRYGTVDGDGVYSSPIANPARRFFTMLGTLVAGRVSVASASITASKVALSTAVRYGALRRQFGPEGEEEQSLLDYPAHREALLPHVAATYALHFSVVDLQRRFAAHTAEVSHAREDESQEEPDSRELEALAAGVKAVSTWHAINSAQAARERCGGMGFLTLNRIAQIRRDVDVFATFEGDNTVLLQLVAKGLLTGFAKQLSDNFVGTLLDTVGEVAKRAFFESNPVETRRTSEEHLLDVDFHREAFRYRTHQLLVSAARRLKKRTDKGVDSFVAFGEIQLHLIALAEAHTTEHIHECFAKGIADCEGPEKAAMESMRELYAVSELHRDVSWFLETEYIAPRKARAIRKLKASLCARVGQDAVAYVDAFGIPDAMLGPIAFENYAEHVMLAGKQS
jgi:acyl-CoA oxidase